MSEPIISVSGLRGTIGDQLTPLVAVRYIAALASTLPEGPVVIGRDGRESGCMLAQIIGATLQAHGHDVIDLGVAATPTVGIEVRAATAVAGVQISASHNPRQYNGIKLFGSEGRVLPKSAGERVLSAYRNDHAKWVDVSRLGAMTASRDAHETHLKTVLATVDSNKIAARKFKVLLDSNHGAGSLLGARLLNDLGCEATIVGGDPNGQFAHGPEPLAENLTEICELVREGDYDVGFCQDPDADRLAIIDEQGNFIGEEMTVALCLMQLFEKQDRATVQIDANGDTNGTNDSESPGTIVINCATSGLARHLADKYGYQLLQSAVGEANVADLMIAEQAIFGGEGNGGPIDPAVGYVRDSFVGMARVLELLALRQKPLSHLVAELPPLSMVKEKAPLDAATLPKLFDALTKEFADAEPSRLDGLKLQWSDRWLLVRGSNTEPIVRFIAEAPTTEEARALCDIAHKASMAVSRA